MTKVKVLAYSVNDRGDYGITFECEFPRCILAQVNTHRQGFSRNTASSRAIPIAKNVETLLATNYVPIWTMNQAGMQGVECDVETQAKATELWYECRETMIDYARKFQELGLHKQNVNRILEPFQTVKTILTAGGDGLENFFKLRIHKDAQPEIQELAIMMKEVMLKSVPKLLKSGEWHLPYITDEDRKVLSLEECKRISVSCCAQVSYRKLDTTPQKALNIFDKLISGDIIHGSAFEHVFRSMEEDEEQLGCLKGFRQFRHEIFK